MSEQIAYCTCDGYIEDSRLEYVHERSQYHVSCDACGMRAEGGDTEEEAVMFWNDMIKALSGCITLRAVVCERDNAEREKGNAR